MIVNDFSRQINILDIEKHGGTPITIVGAGATGSWITLGLAKMGFNNITVYDFDTVGEHNLPNQAFTVDQIGMLKSEAISNSTALHTGKGVNYHTSALNGGERLTGIVIVLTDSMKSRKDIWLKSLKLKPNVECVIETRMDLRCGRVYYVNPNDFTQVKKYEETLYTDAESEVSACGVSQTVLCTALGITSQVIWKVLNHVNGVQNHNETLMEFENNYILTTDWSE